MAHALDRPVWNALTTRQNHLAEGDSHAVRMAADYGLFAAAADRSPESLAALGVLVPADGALATVEAEAFPPIPGTTGETHNIWQMSAERLTSHAAGTPGFEIVALGEADAPEMFDLARLTQPGPFFARTHQLGEFIGVRRDGRLAAMAGERMRPTGFTEVSGVCTHPDHRGHGYAAVLSRQVAQKILDRGETPFLHVYAHNKAAIAIYEALGFSLRHEMTMTVLTRTGRRTPETTRRPRERERQVLRNRIGSRA
jgi:hypothetical protein